MNTSHSTRRNRGFSLVEVTLAVAIAALGIITLLGLLPQGLAISQKTSLMVSNSNILEQVVRDLENAPFALLPAGVVRRYFNDQGNEVDEGSENIGFVVEIDPTQPAGLPKADAAQLYLKRFILRVAATANPAYTFGPTNRMSYVISNHLIAKTR